MTAAGTRRRALALALATLAALPGAAAGAGPTGPNLVPGQGGQGGGVARMAAAQDLYAQGLAARDPTLALAAARLAGEVALAEVSRELERRPGPAGEGPPGAAAVPPDAAAMLAAARALAGEDEVLAALADRLEAEVAQAPDSGAAVSRGVLGPGAAEVWRVPFFGQSLAELAVLGDGDAPLEIRVADEGDRTICQGGGASDRLYCAFVPAWNGWFTVSVTNRGTAANGYMLLTN